MIGRKASAKVLGDLVRVREIWYTPAYRKAVGRVHRMSTHDILNSADDCGTTMARKFQEYRKEGERAILDEIVISVTALQAIVEELRLRHGL
jgi:hypothetical protein